MSYTPPNTFINGAQLDATLVQENNDAMKSYIDGGAVTADVSTAAWVRAPHVMRGTYIPLQNLHEFATGVVRGSTYEPNNVVMSADRYRMTYPSMLSGNDIVATEYTNEASFYTTRVGWQVYPRHLPILTTPTTTVSQSTMTTLRFDYPTYTCQETDAGNYRNDVATFEQSIPGFYRRRAIQNWDYEDIGSVAAGTTNALSWRVGTNNIINDFAEFGYQLEVYYT